MNYAQNVFSISTFVCNDHDLFNTATRCGCRYPRILIFIAPCISTPNGVRLGVDLAQPRQNKGSPAVLPLSDRGLEEWYE